MSTYDPSNPLAGATTCPHCGGLAKVSPHPELRFICNICGAPRIEAKDAALSGREKAPLERARTARRERLLWKVGAVVGGASAAFILGAGLLAALIAGSMSWLLGGVVFAVPWVILTVLGAKNAGGKTSELKGALDEAWRSAARDVVYASKNGITGRELAERLGIDEASAENLIAEVSVDDMVRSRLTDEGRIVLSSIEGMRIDTGAASPAALDPLEEKFAALEAAEAEAAAAPKKRTLS